MSYSFFADRTVTQPDGRYDFVGVHDTLTVPALPHQVTTTLVLVVECEPAERSRDVALTTKVWYHGRTLDRARRAPLTSVAVACPPVTSDRPRYTYLPIAVEFTAADPGAYQIEVDHDGAAWCSATYRVHVA